MGDCRCEALVRAKCLGFAKHAERPSKDFDTSALFSGCFYTKYQGSERRRKRENRLGLDVFWDVNYR